MPMTLYYFIDYVLTIMFVILSWLKIYSKFRYCLLMSAWPISPKLIGFLYNLKIFSIIKFKITADFRSQWDQYRNLISNERKLIFLSINHATTMPLTTSDYSGRHLYQHVDAKMSSNCLCFSALSSPLLYSYCLACDKY